MQLGKFAELLNEYNILKAIETQDTPLNLFGLDYITLYGLVKQGYAEELKSAQMATTVYRITPSGRERLAWLSALEVEVQTTFENGEGNNKVKVIKYGTVGDAHGNVHIAPNKINPVTFPISEPTPIYVQWEGESQPSHENTFSASVKRVYGEPVAMYSDGVIRYLKRGDAE